MSSLPRLRLASSELNQMLWSNHVLYLFVLPKLACFLIESAPDRSLLASHWELSILNQEQPFTVQQTEPRESDAAGASGHLIKTQVSGQHLVEQIK